jgi:hypothetical protein
VSAATAALMERIKTEGTFNVLAEILADAAELVYRLDDETAGTQGAERFAKNSALAEGENLCDGLIEAMTCLPSEGVAGAAVHLVLANDFLASARSWAEQTESTERRDARLKETTEAAVRCMAFALPALLALPEAKLARRIAKRYVIAGLLEQATGKAP